MSEPAQIPLDLDRIANLIGRLTIENLGLQQQLEAAQNSTVIPETEVSADGVS